MDGDVSMLAHNAHSLQVVALTSKCGESSSPVTQLQVVKALLTYATGVCGQTQTNTTLHAWAPLARVFSFGLKFICLDVHILC